MSDIYIERSHNFDMDTARQKIKVFLQEVETQFGVDLNYQQGDGKDTIELNKMGVSAKGYLTAEKVVLDAELSFLAKPFKDNIQAGIEQGLDRFFV